LTPNPHTSINHATSNNVNNHSTIDERKRIPWDHYATWTPESLARESKQQLDEPFKKLDYLPGFSNPEQHLSPKRDGSERDKAVKKSRDYLKVFATTSAVDSTGKKDKKDRKDKKDKKHKRDLKFDKK